MCTAITFKTKDRYFGRNLDLEYSYDESVTVTGRNFPFGFNDSKSHYALIGMAFVYNNYPLYYDATNEKGLSMAGLYFPDNAKLGKDKADKINLASYEFIPYVLGQCKDIEEARALLENINVTDKAFDKNLPSTPLHWIIADKEKALTVEQTESGLHIYENPVGVLTNNPPFPYQMMNLNNYINLTPKEPENTFSSFAPLKTYCKGMGAIGLPGDLSSASRFVRTAFTKLNSKCGESEEESISQFFHVLASVNHTRGCSLTADGKSEITVYSSCCNVDKGIYYYRTYENSRICAVKMHSLDLDTANIYSYPIKEKQDIQYEN